MLTDKFTLTIRREDIGGLSPREVQDAILSASITKNGWSNTQAAVDEGRLEVICEFDREKV